ncbi:ankyrin repeat and MYND domain-containing protein 1 isoform X2 [Scyliorhinus torazame]|uniref:ankyrin repeat and MYND domain-containing protein 1 isoform X2 n=1 Tax=Scyliorhinus torazame TaxID=75743 RepID=UPI003B59C54A
MPSPVPSSPAGSPQSHSPEDSHRVQGPLDSPELLEVTAKRSTLAASPAPEAGVQEWPNGWKYEGGFRGNLKHGQGVFQWANGEYYTGQFYKDHRHGNGTYVWPDGNKFTGMFYLDRKDGYGTLEMKDGCIFQGLYKADERFGPGVLTYPNGHQDVGLWYRNHLIRLCSAMPGDFTVKNHPLYHLTTKEIDIPLKAYKEKYFWRADPEEDPFFYPYKKFLFDDSYTLPAEIGTYSTDADHLPLTRSYTRDGDRHFFQEDDELGDEDLTEKITITNQTPLMVKMQMHIHRHRRIQAMLKWNVTAIIEGNRDSFGPKGPLECSSEQLIVAAGEGDYVKVHEILKTNLVNADVADVHGHMSLIGASVVCSALAINLLLDYGANVNKLNNEGVSALNCSSTLYYPSGSFLHKDIFNIANGRETPVDKGSSKVLSDEELTTQVKIAKRLSIYDRKIRLGSISFKKIAVIPLLDSKHELNHLDEENVEEEILNFEDLLGEDVTDFETEEDTESLASPSAGAPSTQFESTRSVHHFHFSVTGQQLQRAAQVLSRNQQFRMSAEKALGSPEFKHNERIWRIATMKSLHRRRREIINLLLRRGADPNNSTNPLPPLFSAVLAGDIEAVQFLLENRADPNNILTSQIKGMQGLPILQVAVDIPGKKGVMITQLLLNAAANPDQGADDGDEIYPLDVYAHQIVRQLLKHKANPNLLWSGHSPLSLAIASGNDLAVDELLANGADPNLALTQGVGSALCAALNTTYEQKRSLTKRLTLVDKLLTANANILMPITLKAPDGQVTGTALDYGYHKYYQDSKIAQTPYHALTPEERETFNARHELLNYLSQPFRKFSISKERKRFDDIIQQSLQSRETSETVSELSESEALSLAEISLTAKAILERHSQTAEGNLPISPVTEKKGKIQETAPRRQLFKFKFCYYCGRSVGVRLILCSRCKEVYYCSKACKVAAWNEFHKDECYLTKGRAANKKGDGLFWDDGLTRSESSSPSAELDNYSFN